MEIITFGGGERLRACATFLPLALGDDGCSDARVIILPIPTTRDKKTVTGTGQPLSEVCSQVTEGTLVAGYGIPKGVCREIEERGGAVYDGAEDEELIMRNAVLTAEGTVGRIICGYGRALSDLKIGIVGYGRIGAALARILLFLGSSVKIYSGRASTVLELTASGIEAACYGSPMGLCELDILINTAPAAIVTAKDLPERGEVKIIDLASGNYLEDLPRVEKMPSVPEKLFPITAGKIYAERIAAEIKRIGDGGSACRGGE